MDRTELNKAVEGSNEGPHRPNKGQKGLEKGPCRPNKGLKGPNEGQKGLGEIKKGPNEEPYRTNIKQKRPDFGATEHGKSSEEGLSG